MKNKFINYLRLIRFDKPIGTLLLLWPTLWAVFLASNGKPHFYLILVFSLGVFLTRSAGVAINDVLDIKFDKCVERTKMRPLVVRSVDRFEALIVATVLLLISFFLAYHFLKPETLLLSIPALLVLVTYPFMKRLIAIPQAYLGVAYSFGILMAYIEIGGALNLSCLLLFIANLFWVLGYDTIYAMVDMKDDIKTKIKTSALTLGDKIIPFMVAFYLTFIILIAIVAVINKLSFLFWVFWFISFLLLMYQILILTTSDRLAWFKMFLLNNRVGYIMLLAIVLGLWLHH